MDLKTKDVADLLHVSETTVRRLVANGNIPAYRLNRQYRFSRAEFEDWLVQQKLGASVKLGEEHREEETLASKAGSMQYNLFRALYRGEVLSYPMAMTKEELFRQTMDHIARGYDLDAGVLLDLFLDRERMMPTGLGHGIAVPHARDFRLHTHHDAVVVVYPAQPLVYDALDGEPVHVLFFLFAANDRSHLNLLSKIAHLSTREQNRAFFRTKPSKERILEFVKQWESSLKI